MNYIAIYDVAQESSFGADILVATFFLLIASGFSIGVFVHSYRKQQFRKSFGAMLATLFFLLIGGTLFGTDLSARGRCRQLLVSGDYITIEGKIKNFKPFSSSSKTESFTVGPYDFWYRRADLTHGCFKNQYVPSELIEEGREVRIIHKRGNILRIEIKKV